MNTKISFVVFCGIVGLSVAFPSLPQWPSIPWKVGTCKFNIYQENFKPELFFTGKWYELLSFGSYPLEAGGTCPTMATEIKGNDINLLSYQYEKILGKYVSLRGTADLTKVDKSNYKVKYDFMAGLASVQVPFTVLSTDYDSYALVYSCQEAFGLVAESAWISTRVPGDHSKLETVKEIVDVAGLKYTDFEEKEALNCPPNPPEL